MFIEKLLTLMAEKKASDIFISNGSPISIKITGTIMPVNPQSMDAEQCKKIIYEMLTPTQMWQVSQLLAHADKLPDPTKAALAKPAALPVAPPSPTPAAMQGKKPTKLSGK